MKVHSFQRISHTTASHSLVRARFFIFLGRSWSHSRSLTSGQVFAIAFVELIPQAIMHFATHRFFQTETLRLFALELEDHFGRRMVGIRGEFVEINSHWSVVRARLA